MKIIAGYTEVDLQDPTDFGDDVEYEQECSTPEEAVSFVNSHSFNLTPDGHSVTLDSIKFGIDSELFCFDEVCEEAGNEELFDAFDGGYLREIDITVDDMTGLFEAAERLAARAD